MLRRRVFGVLVVIGALVLSMITPAGAQDDPQDQVAAIDLTARRSGSGAKVVPVQVTLLARRALEGDLVIEADSAGVNWDVPVQVAANTEATQTILVPVTFNEIDVKARLLIDGAAVAEEELRVFDGAGPMNAVGLIGVDSNNALTPLSPPIGDAALIPMNDMKLLNGLDSVVASPAGLRALSDDERAILLTWVSAGRQLIVADGVTSIDEILPPEWRARSSVVLAGSGIIRYTGPDWVNQIPPGPTLSTDAGLITGFGQLPHSELLNDAGFRIPGIGIIALILGLYLVVAGPITFAVLAARGKQTLTWVVLPGLAVAFTAGVFVVGGILTSGRGNGHATVAEVSPVGTALTDTMLIADDGRQTVELPVGWSLSSARLNSSGGSIGSPVVIEPTAGADRVVFEIDPGSGGTAIVHGRTANLTDALQILDLTTSSDELRATVQNNSGEELLHVVALIGGRLAEIGSLANGESREFTIDLARRARSDAPELRTWNVDESFFFNVEFGQPVGPGFGGRGDVSNAVAEGPINGSAWVDWRASRVGSAAPRGVVTVVGWTRNLNESLLNGRGRTALVARYPITAVDGPVHADLIREVPATVFNPFGPEPFGPGFDSPADTVQYIRPAGSDTSQVAIEVGEATSELQIWTGSDWRSFVLPDFGRVEIVLPEEAWNGDVLWLRASTAGFFGDPNLTSVALTARDGNTEEAALLPVGERHQREGLGGEFFPPEEVPVELAETFTVELDESGFFEGQSSIFNSYDVWELELSEGDNVVVTMDGFNEGTLDSFLVVIDPDGRQVAENDDYGRGLDSQVVFTASTTGVYSIETRPLYNGSNGEYAVIIEVDQGAAA